MSNKTQLQTNNNLLDSYITRINAAKEVAADLPQAGSAGGSSVELCEVAVECGSGGPLGGGAAFDVLMYTTLENGVLKTKCIEYYRGGLHEVISVVVGTDVIIGHDIYGTHDFSTSENITQVSNVWNNNTNIVNCTINSGTQGHIFIS